MRRNNRRPNPHPRDWRAGASVSALTLESRSEKSEGNDHSACHEKHIALLSSSYRRASLQFRSRGSPSGIRTVANGWVHLTYIKLHENIEIDEYIEKRVKLVQRACENAIAAGHMLDWALYRVEGAEDYDLVSAKVGAALDGLAKVAGPQLETFLDDS